MKQPSENLNPNVITNLEETQKGSFRSNRVLERLADRKMLS